MQRVTVQIRPASAGERARWLVVLDGHAHAEYGQGAGHLYHFDTPEDAWAYAAELRSLFPEGRLSIEQVDDLGLPVPPDPEVLQEVERRRAQAERAAALHQLSTPTDSRQEVLFLIEKAARSSLPAETQRDLVVLLLERQGMPAQFVRAARGMAPEAFIARLRMVFSSAA